jgi:probable H4MPT-linked C1 transfer pathway protein
MMPMAGEIVGWDVGGAHLKAALLNSDGLVVRVLQHPCPLWQGLHTLHQAFAHLLEQLPRRPRLHVLTMTGELVDLFAGREEGVLTIVAESAKILGADRLRIFAGKIGFIDPNHIAPALTDAIASANWYTSAAYAAKRAASALFIDIGSTTSDVLLIHDGAVQPVGLTDYERLVSEELVYTGIVRTPVIAVVRSAVFKGRRIGLMAEYFATMADVYRLTGELDEVHDQTPSADGAPKTIDGSARRLARMIGCDLIADELPHWVTFAHHLRNRQLQIIQHACERLLSRSADKAGMIFIGAGIGRFLVQELGRRLGYPYHDFVEFFPPLSQDSPMSCADCAPAVAVAALAYAVCED